MSSTFLTITGLFNFYSLNLYLAAVFLFINIPAMLLFKSTFIIIPLCIFTFSTLISSHTSLNILNVLLTSLCLPPSLAVPFGVSVHVLPCCTFLSVGHTTSPQFHHSLFLPTLHSGYKILFFLILIPFSQLHSSFHTLHTPLFSSLLSLLLLLSSSMLLGIGYTIHFLLVSQEGILVPNFCESVPPCLYILYSSHTLPPSPSLSIFSLAEVHLWGAYSSLYNIPVPFPI